MRILLVSDIHSNLEAWQACLSAFPAHDLVVNLGDIVGYGASPNEVTECARQLGRIFVRGNHDKACTGITSTEEFNPIAAAAAEWTRHALTDDNLEFLRNLPEGPVRAEDVADAQFVHGSPFDEDEYLVTLRDALDPLFAADRPVTFFGHTHIQGAFWIEGDHGVTLRPDYGAVKKTEIFELELKPGAKYMINPGSIGQPRDGDPRAAFALFDTEAQKLVFHRVPYDIKQAQQRILDAKLPPRLATRLGEGR